VSRSGVVAQQVLVLNATYEPINVCTLQRAIVLVLKNKAEVVERGARRLRTATSAFIEPLVIRLVYYVRVPRFQARRISRRAVFARDGHSCQYCGSGSRLTVDHVVPKSRGGNSSWENVVTACAPCNTRKGDRLPAEIDMHPRSKPRAPTPNELIAVATQRRPASWDAYLPI
jgi:5-methylcytosine-specific restriction endonuclease McrA